MVTETVAAPAVEYVQPAPVAVEYVQPAAATTGYTGAVI